MLGVENLVAAGTFLIYLKGSVKTNVLLRTFCCDSLCLLVERQYTMRFTAESFVGGRPGIGVHVHVFWFRFMD